jgi:hypothetical protein
MAIGFENLGNGVESLGPFEGCHGALIELIVDFLSHRLIFLKQIAEAGIVLEIDAFSSCLVQNCDLFKVRLFEVSFVFGEEKQDAKHGFFVVLIKLQNFMGNGIASIFYFMVDAGSATEKKFDGACLEMVCGLVEKCLAVDGWHVELSDWLRTKGGNRLRRRVRMALA